MHSSFVEHMERNTKSHTVTNRTRRSERSSSNHYLAFECNRMQQRKNIKGKMILPARRCSVMYNGHSLTQGEEVPTFRSRQTGCRVLGRPPRLESELQGGGGGLEAGDRAPWGGKCCGDCGGSRVLYPKASGLCCVLRTTRVEPADAGDGPRGRTYKRGAFPRAPLKRSPLIQDTRCQLDHERACRMLSKGS